MPASEVTTGQPIDLRSDTVTKPSLAMRRAMADAEVGDDDRDGDPTTRRLEAMVAEMLGKDAALFFPTGSMANQAAVWLHTTPGSEVIIDHDAHIVHWEAGGASALAGVQLRLVKGDTPAVRASDVAAAFRVPSADAPEAKLVSVENTHNGGGGVITPLAELKAIRAVADSHRVPMHLDGARLWNASIASGTSLADFAACADTVMVSFSKGLGAPIGGALIGSKDVIARAHRVRKRFGGSMRQSGVLAAAAIHGIEQHMSRLADDHAAAREIAKAVDGAGGGKVVAPESNIVMIDLPTATAANVVARAKSLGLLVSAWTPSRIRVVTHMDVTGEAITAAGRLLARALID